MKKLILFTSLIISANGFADELHNFNQVKSAVTTGKSIRIAVDFSKCSPSKKSDFQNKYNMGIFTPNEITVNGDGQIAASLMHFTMNDASFPAKPVYQFLRYTMTSDDSVNLSFQVLDAASYKSVSDKISFNCKIDAGAKIYD